MKEMSNLNIINGLRNKTMKRGFTLIELLIIIAIISLLSAMVIHTVANVNKNKDNKQINQEWIR